MSTAGSKSTSSSYTQTQTNQPHAHDSSIKTDLTSKQNPPAGERRVRWVSDVDEDRETDIREPGTTARDKKTGKPKSLKSTPYPGTENSSKGKSAKMLPKLPIKGTPYPAAGADGDVEDEEQSGQTEDDVDESSQLRIGHENDDPQTRSRGLRNGNARNGNAERDHYYAPATSTRAREREPADARAAVVSSSGEDSKEFDSSDRKMTRTALSLRKLRDSARSIRRTAAKSQNRVRVCVCDF